MTQPDDHAKMTNGEISTMLAIACGVEPEEVVDFLTIALVYEGPGVRAIMNTSMEDPDAIELLARSINHLIQDNLHDH